MKSYTTRSPKLVLVQITLLSESLVTHYLPNLYPTLADLTPEKKIYNRAPDLEQKFGSSIR